MHGFDSLTPIEETLRALDELVRAGKARQVGCSKFSGWHSMKSLSLAERNGWPRNEAQLRDNLGATESMLNSDQMKRLDTVSARVSVYPYWRQRAIFGERNPPPVS